MKNIKVGNSTDFLSTKKLLLIAEEQKRKEEQLQKNYLKAQQNQYLEYLEMFTTKKAEKQPKQKGIKG